MKKIWIKLSIAFVCFFLGACASSAFYPVPDNVVGVDDTFAIIRTDSVMIIVRPESAMLDSHIMSKNYFCIYVQIRNLSQSTLPLKNKQVAIIAQNVQFDPLPLNYLLQLLRLEMTMTQNPDPFNIRPSAVSMEEYQNTYAALTRDYLVLSDVLPGSVKEGYLYFSNSIKGASEFALHLDQWRILFERKQKRK